MRSIIYLLFFFCLFSVAFASCGESDDIKENKKPEPISAPEPEIAIENFGVNLSGAEFSYVYPGVDGTHYGYPTTKCLDYFNSKGLKLIRFPFRWERIQHDLNGDLVQTEINKMKNFVKAAEDRDMPIILDLHNFARRSFDGGSTFVRIGDNGLTADHLGDVWLKLAKEFKSYTNILGYDIMNEPYSMASTTQWRDIAQVVIYKIRSVDTETPIIISGDRYSSSEHWVQFSDNLRTLIDPSNKLIFQAHIYFDKDSSGTYKNSFEDEGATNQTGVDRVKPFVEWLKKYNKKGLVGEYGVPSNEPRYLPVLENMLKYLRENGVPGTYWSAGPRWNESAPHTLSVQPTENYTKDKPQIAVLKKYTKTDSK